MLEGLYLSNQRDKPRIFSQAKSEPTYLRRRRGFRLSRSSLGDKPKMRWVLTSLFFFFLKIGDWLEFGRTRFSRDLQSHVCLVVTVFAGVSDPTSGPFSLLELRPDLRPRLSVCSNALDLKGKVVWNQLCPGSYLTASPRSNFELTL